MPLYPLGITHSQDAPSVPQQAAGAVSMRWSLSGELACAYIDAPHGAIQPMLHASALETIHRRICVLPVRYGLALRNEAEIGDLLENHRHALLESLRRLDSTCEMGLRIPIPNASKTLPAASSSPPSPLAHMEERFPHYRRVDKSHRADNGEEQDPLIVGQFVERLQGCYRQWRKLQSPHAIRLAFLVEQNRVMFFRKQVEDARRKEEADGCVILGPWPPYSFV
jgi:hypothetical protein